MRKLLRFSVLLLAAGLIFGLAGCDDGSGKNEKDPGGGDGDGINWSNDKDATLTVFNGTAKDMVIFYGQTPSAGNILGGVRAGVGREFNVANVVDDFQVGGYLILRGMTLDEYNANKSNVSQAKLEYSAMATYGQGKKFRTEIYPNYMGDYGYRVTNIGKLGIELRKDSPDGEKVGYLPALASNSLLYAGNTDGFALYPVYVYFNRQNGQVSTLRPTSQFDTVSVSPRALGNASQIQTYIFPADEGATWDSIKNSITSPVAYVTVSNTVPNQSGRVTIAGSNRLYSQNGYDSIGSGETLSYEIESTAEGREQYIVLQFYNGTISIPVAEYVTEGTQNNFPSFTHDGVTLGTNKRPMLKNGYDYNITVAGSGNAVTGYTVTITESANARDISGMIDSL